MPDLPRHIGRYAVVRELGRGGMGVVYEVRHPEIPRPLALKQVLASAVTPEVLLRFAREGQLLARISHRGVVRVHQLDNGSQGPFLVTDLVEGRLLTALARDGGLAPREAARLVREVADAVVALHAAGVLHRDLKGDNVLVQADGQPVLVDFGLGRDARTADALTVTGTVLGTPTHMSPEQAAGAPVGEATDAWGLGALLHEALTGRPPFLAETVTETLRLVLHAEAPSPARLRPEVPRALDDLVRRTLVKDPADRPSPAALRDALDAYLRGAAGGAPRGVPRGLLLALAGALLVAALLALRPAPAPPDEVSAATPPPSAAPASPAGAPAAARPSVVASIAARARAPAPCLVETLPRATRGAFTGDHLVTWSPRGRELRVWTPGPSGALEARIVPLDDTISAVCADPDLPAGAPPIVAVLTASRLLTVDLRSGAQADLGRAPEGLAGLVLDPPRLVFGAETDQLSLLALGDPGAARQDLVPAPIRARVRTLVAGSGVAAVIDDAERVFVWETHGAAEARCAQAPGKSLAAAHGRVLVGSERGDCLLFGEDMLPLGAIQTGQVDAPVHAVALAHGTAALLVGAALHFAGEVGPTWATRPPAPGADGLALDPTGQVALVCAPGGVQVWSVGHALTPFATTGDNGLDPVGTLPGLDAPVAGGVEAAWLPPREGSDEAGSIAAPRAPLPIDRLVVSSLLAGGRRRLRSADLLGDRARPALAHEELHTALAVIGSQVVLENGAGTLMAATQLPELDRALLLAAAPDGAGLVGLTRGLELRRAPVLGAGDVPSTRVGTLFSGATPRGLAVARGGRVALASARELAPELGDPEGIVELWDPGGAPSRPPDRTLRFIGGVPVLAFSPDGTRLAIGYGAGALFVVDPATAAGSPDPALSLGEPDTPAIDPTGARYVHEGRVGGSRFLGDDELVSTSSHLEGTPGRRARHELRRWRRTGATWASVGSAVQWTDGALATGLVASPDGRRLAVPTADGRVALFAVRPR